MSEPNNVDATLIRAMSEQVTGQQPPQPPVIQPEIIQEQPVADLNPPVENSPPEVEVKEETTPAKEAKEDKEEPSDKPIDEYGNPVEKPKTYTEDEVQRMIRERLSRGRHSEPQPTQQPIRKEAENFQADPENPESWDVQLENFIERTIEKKQVKMQEQQWKQAESARQAEFESKFTSDMNKYSDFHKVVEGKPITDSMMLAARTLDNPAAFIYGACKMHPQELQNISSMNDRYAQAAAIGRLHEKMVKNRAAISQAPRPIEVPKGDLPNKVLDKISLEQRIHEYAKQKRK